jgi:tRNA nucleotidyltransferase (CCA-adding enzyme)
MTIRRRDRGLSGGDMGCDGSWDMTDDLLERLRELPGADALFDALADVPGVWVVGGAVRDVLLGRAPRDLDLVVEGDAAEVARRLGEAPLVHERFGTATANGTINVAAARRERYARPGALPDVELGAPIEEDLARRDFTVNAIAARLADGELRSVPGALEDLAAHRLRVLHERSFLDDPTRLLRLLRYAARLRFAIEEATRGWAFDAVESGALETVTAARLGGELRLLMQEPMPGAVCGLEAFAVGPALLPGFHVDPDLVERAQRLIPEDGRPDLVALAACCLDASAPVLAERLDGYELPARERDTTVAAATRARGLAPVLGGLDDPSAIWALLRRETPETVALAGALGAQDNARRWLEDLRHARLTITGDDLLAAGVEGPAIGRGLEAATAALLDGEAEDRQAQLAAALKGAAEESPPAGHGHHH